MYISWLQKLSLIDYPGNIACIVFTPGCNLRCGYCHNPDFVLPERIQKLKNSWMNEELFFDFLKKRQWLIDGVSICWGEPTLQGDIIPFCERVHSMGFSIKLDTNGTNPHVLQDLLKRKIIDYVAMDIKDIWGWYENLTGICMDIEKYKESAHIIIAHAPQYEFRTTVIAWVHTPESIWIIASYIQGASNYFLQNYRPKDTLNPNFIGSSVSDEILIKMQSQALYFVKKCEIRN